MLEAILRCPALAERSADWLLLIAKSVVVVGVALAAVRLLGLAV